ncbi:hypothetical protein WR25_00928 [Diploscapter pachys]|uniref:Kinesin-like protein n=1 Tax=Diploscapter pachys TaxID=2018661 RepID=A0A2A2KW04_9BILA|nr:hypothetical protein WR25_00928 [Diploscapter pachys]
MFAYGQTGSGKTHTMLGAEPIEQGLYHEQNRGIIPRAVQHLFELLQEKNAKIIKYINSQKSKSAGEFNYVVHARFVELYKDELHDLLGPNNQLKLRDYGEDVVVTGAEERQIDCTQDALNILKLGFDNRKVGGTAMNQHSSRSHAIFIMNIETKETVGNFTTKRKSQLNLVDLAGSEKQQSARSSGERFKEATHINGSLSVLGRVIRSLAANPSKYISYRDSYLTHILRNSLGGNSRTVVIVNVHQNLEYASDTISSFAFAESCSKITNRVKVNEDLEGDSLSAWKEEVKRLKGELIAAHNSSKLGKSITE